MARGQETFQDYLGYLQAASAFLFGDQKVNVDPFVLEINRREEELVVLQVEEGLAALSGRGRPRFSLAGLSRGVRRFLGVMVKGSLQWGNGAAPGAAPIQWRLLLRLDVDALGELGEFFIRVAFFIKGLLE